MPFGWRTYLFATVTGAFAFYNNIHADNAFERVVLILVVGFGIWFWGVIFSFMYEADREAKERKNAVDN